MSQANKIKESDYTSTPLAISASPHFLSLIFHSLLHSPHIQVSHPVVGENTMGGPGKSKTILEHCDPEG